MQFGYKRMCKDVNFGFILRLVKNKNQLKIDKKQFEIKSIKSSKLFYLQYVRNFLQTVYIQLKLL